MKLRSTPEIDITAGNWGDFQAAGFRHFLNVAPEKLAEGEFLDLVALARGAGGGENGLAFGAFFDVDRQEPLDDHCDLGLYVKRPEGWTPF